jgi:polysaccharide chain length determinant protein (PEP-CTERM system associated)
MQVSSREDSVFSMLSMLWKRRKWPALVVFAAGFAATLGFVTALPNIYSATATVLVDKEASPSASVPGAAGDSFAIELDSVTEEVLSRARLQDLISRFNLYPDLRQRLSPDAMVARMRRDIQLDRKEGAQQWGRDPTFAFTISYQGWDPQTVAQVTNALTSSYVEESNNMHARQTATTASALRSQLAAIRQKLDSQEQQINGFRDTHIGELPEQQQANLVTLERLNTQLHLNSEDQIHAMERREQLLKQGTDTGEASLPQLQQQLDSLRTRYTDKYPDIIRIKAQIASMKHGQDQTGDPGAGHAASSTGQQIQELDNEINSLKQDENRLRAQIAVYQSRIDNLPIREEQLQSLTQGYVETKDVYSSLLKRYEETRLVEAPAGVQGSEYRIVDVAAPPRDPTAPNRMRLILMGLVLCLGLSAAAVVLAEQLDTSFHSLDELRAFTAVPILVSIPHIATAGDAWRRRARFGAIAASVVVMLVLIVQLSYFLGHGSQQLVWILVKHAS